MGSHEKIILYLLEWVLSCLMYSCTRVPTRERNVLEYSDKYCEYNEHLPRKLLVLLTMFSIFEFYLCHSGRNCNIAMLSVTRVLHTSYTCTRVCMSDGWMDGWIDGWEDGWMDGRTDGWMDVLQ